MFDKYWRRLLSLFLERRSINKKKKMSATPSRRSPGQPGYDPNLVEVKSKVSPSDFGGCGLCCHGNSAVMA